MPERKPETESNATEAPDGIRRRTLLRGVTATAFLGTTGATARENSRDARLAGLRDELASLGTYGAASQEQEPLRFQYAVKFVCGESDGKAVLSGMYRTAVNLHNPNAERVPFRWKVAPAFVEQAGEPSEFVDFGSPLAPDQAFEIDCELIFDHDVEIRQEGFLKGFVVVESDVELDVVAVYSAGRETVQTIDVEQIAPREMDREDDDGPDELPDLVPVPQPNLFPAFCRRSQDLKELLVVVENQGSGDAGPSVTRVDFGNDRVVERDTPTLDAEDRATLAFPFPPASDSCFRPDCPFTITVDAGDDVDESNEGNNVVSDLCLG